jgi:16S rRNA (guanine(527)-N(7))-methyltransferase RsmG
MVQRNNEILNLFLKSGISLSSRQLDQFDAYYALISKYNDSLDLSRLKTFEDIIIKHFIDSVYFTKFVQLPSPALDIGTGAGFPGIPLKILDPGLKLILSEPRKKRASFLGLVIQALGLEDIEVYPHMVTDRSFFSVNGVITRALEKIDDTLARVSHFLDKGGMVFFMKGPEADSDLNQISEKNRLSFTLEFDREYLLPATSYSRRIIVFKKSSSDTRKTYSILKNKTGSAGTAIMSADNKRFKDLKKIISGAGTRKTGAILISGKKIIIEFMKRAAFPVRNFVLYDGYVEDSDAMNEIIADMERRSVLFVLKRSLFNEIDLFNTRGPLLAADMPEIKEWDLSVAPGCTLLVPFQDPANVGSAIRSAAGFGVKKIVILKEGANPYHPKSIRASAGTVFGVTVLSGPSLHDLSVLMEDKSSIVALDKSGPPLYGFHFPERFLLLPGIEGPGLPDDLKSRSVSIPLEEEVESLNAPVAVSVALYEWSRAHSPSN